MKRIFVLMMIMMLLLTGCQHNTMEATMKKQSYLGYRENIKNLDSSLTIYTTVTDFSSGGYAVTHSIETSSGDCFGVRFTSVSSKKTEFLVEFNDAESSWSEYNEYLLCDLICCFSENEFSLTEIKSMVHDMQTESYIRINSQTSLFWDDYHDTIYYEETLSD